MGSARAAGHIFFFSLALYRKNGILGLAKEKKRKQK
jgi:hypothetical protein